MVSIISYIQDKMRLLKELQISDKWEYCSSQIKIKNNIT